MVIAFPETVRRCSKGSIPSNRDSLWPSGPNRPLTKNYINLSEVPSLIFIRPNFSLTFALFNFNLANEITVQATLSSELGMAKAKAKSRGPDRSAVKTTFFFFLILAALFLVARSGLLSGPWDTLVGASPIYDTDARNDRDIKRNLTRAQLRLLDRILEAELDQGGRRLGDREVRQIARGDKAVMAAYDRWRAYLEMRRSSNYVIYPRDRGR